MEMVVGLVGCWWVVVDMEVVVVGCWRVVVDMVVDMVVDVVVVPCRILDHIGCNNSDAH